MLAGLRRLPPNVQGALWLVAGGFIFTSTGAMIRLLSLQIDSVQTAFFRAAIGLAMLLPLIATGRVVPWHSKRIAGHFWRTFMGTTSMVLGFYAVSMLPLADATAIAFSQPLFSVVVAVVIAGEKVRWRRWTATVVGFAGVLVMVRPGFEAFNLGLAAVFVASIAGAGAAVLIRYLSRTESPDTITMYFAIFTTPVMLILALFVWQTPTWDQIGWLTFMGLTGTLGQRAVARGFAAADASIVLPMEFSRLIVAAVFGFILFAEIPSVYTAIGGLLIFGSTAYIAQREARQSRKRAASTSPSTSTTE